GRPKDPALAASVGVADPSQAQDDIVATTAEKRPPGSVILREVRPKDPLLVVRPKLRILRRLRMTVTHEDMESIYRPGKTGLPSTEIWRMNCSLCAVIASGTVAYARSLLNRCPSCVAHTYIL